MCAWIWESTVILGLLLQFCRLNYHKFVPTNPLTASTEQALCYLTRDWRYFNSIKLLRIFWWIRYQTWYILHIWMSLNYTDRYGYMTHHTQIFLPISFSFNLIFHSRYSRHSDTSKKWADSIEITPSNSQNIYFLSRNENPNMRQLSGYYYICRVYTCICYS